MHKLMTIFDFPGISEAIVKKYPADKPKGQNKSPMAWMLIIFCFPMAFYIKTINL